MQLEDSKAKFTPSLPKVSISSLPVNKKTEAVNADASFRLKSHCGSMWLTERLLKEMGDSIVNFVREHLKQNTPSTRRLEGIEWFKAKTMYRIKDCLFFYQLSTVPLFLSALNYEATQVKEWTKKCVTLFGEKKGTSIMWWQHQSWP